MAGMLLVAGSAVFLVGAAVGVPRVFTEPDASVRLRMLTEHRDMWRTAQPLYALGPIIASAGVARLAASAPTDAARVLLAASALAFLTGALAWAWSVYLRATRIPEFALGTLPGWPFATYVLLTIGGLGLVGIGLASGGFPAWAAWVTLGAAVLFLAAYVRFRDIPPFVFYLLLTLVGAAVW
jgi:hypothetical protein